MRALIAALGFLAALPAGAATLTGPHLSLTYDPALWRPLPPAPPAEAALACLDPACPAGTRLVVLFDPRPLLLPGAAPFGPGILGAALLPARAATSSPGERLRLRGPVLPGGTAGAPAYRAVYGVEDRALVPSERLVLSRPRRGGVLDLRLSAAAFTPAALPRLDDLLVGVMPVDGSP